MKVTLDREGKNVVKVGLELEAEKASRAYEITCRELSHQVEIPGFRKGKAPRNIIEKRFGRDLIKKEALERLVPELLQQVITEKSLDIITSPTIEECKFELGEPLTLLAKFEVRPDVELGQYKGVSVNVPEAQLPGDALDRALDNIAEQKATLKPVESREVKNDDNVLLDFECLVDSELVEGGKAEGLNLEVREGAFLPGFCEKLVGHKPGDKFDVEVKFPDDYRNKNLAGKPAVFKVELRELRERVTPEINDDLAKSLGHETLASLKSAVEDRMKEEVDQENRARSQKAVVEAIVSASTVDIPDSMIDREHDLLMQQLKHFVEGNGQDWNEYTKSEEWQSVNDGRKTEAKQRVLHSLVLGAIVRAENLNVTEDEVAPYLAEIAVRNNVPPERYREMAQDEYLMRQITEEVLTNKVVDFLVDSAAVKYVPDEEAESKKGKEKSEKAEKVEAPAPASDDEAREKKKEKKKSSSAKE